jgi:hypothetical protein
MKMLEPAIKTKPTIENHPKRILTFPGFNTSVIVIVKTPMKNIIISLKA